MKAKDWIYVAAVVAAFVLGALLFRGCPKPETVEVVKWRAINLDSLKATIEPLKIEVPGPERQVLRYVTVSIPDQRAADSLAARYAELANRYGQLEEELRAAWNQGQGGIIEWQTSQHTYKDSVTTPQYFHRWEIVAEGPILSYMPQIIPFYQPAPASKPPKLHRVGAFFGGQTASGALRPLCSGEYSYNWISVNAGYLPPVNRLSLPGEFQVGVGLNVGLK